jgi:hypothetical protein
MLTVPPLEVVAQPMARVVVEVKVAVAWSGFTTSVVPLLVDDETVSESRTVSLPSASALIWQA